MKSENRKIFEDNHKHYNTLINAGYMVHLSGRDRSELVKAMSEEFQPGYTADLWCPPCVATMMHQVYRRYLQFLEEEKRLQVVPEPIIPVVIETEPEAPKEVTDPLVDFADPVAPEPEKVPDPPVVSPPVPKKANFPSHKNNNHRR